ncbi:hypothetical protein GW17_00026097 [Ensete ventricosum]|nr:hypothetical protein GW17_00026097 [Ensete ventricosum]
MLLISLKYNKGVCFFLSRGSLKWFVVVGCRRECSDVAVLLELPTARDILRRICYPPKTAAPGAVITPCLRFIFPFMEMVVVAATGVVEEVEEESEVATMVVGDTEEEVAVHATQHHTLAISWYYYLVLAVVDVEANVIEKNTLCVALHRFARVVRHPRVANGIRRPQAKNRRQAIPSPRIKIPRALLFTDSPARSVACGSPTRFVVHR